MRRQLRRNGRFWLGWFLALNVLWLAFISAFDVAETVVGMVASAIAATAATAVRKTGLVEFRPRIAWLLAIWRVGPRIFVETYELFMVLWRRIVRGEPIRGRFRAEPFRIGREARRASARRAVRTIGESIAPNAYVVGIDEERHEVLVHEILTRPPRVPPRKS
jgi:multisubunit Na+/H+ antiporter MnhE subunit